MELAYFRDVGFLHYTNFVFVFRTPLKLELFDFFEVFATVIRCLNVDFVLNFFSQILTIILKVLNAQYPQISMLSRGLNEQNNCFFSTLNSMANIIHFPIEFFFHQFFKFLFITY